MDGQEPKFVLRPKDWKESLERRLQYGKKLETIEDIIKSKIFKYHPW